MAIWFTSDEHHGHDRIIKYCGRPFHHADHMSQVIVSNHNSQVKDDDVVYHLGDFSMVGSDNTQFYRRLMKKYRPVKERHLILGNHDQLKPWSYVELGFDSVHTSLWLDKDTLLCHDPCVFQVGCTAITGICGHIHGLWKSNDWVINVGVDVWGFKPVSFDELMEVRNAKSNDGV